MKYVVLYHTGIPQPHFDLMIESTAGGMLVTWRCANWPPLVGDLFEPLPEHRREYLNYEGPVSGNRGEVRRVAHGECKMLSSGKAGWQAVFENGLTVKLPRFQKDKK